MVRESETPPEDPVLESVADEVDVADEPDSAAAEAEAETPLEPAEVETVSPGPVIIQGIERAQERATETWWRHWKNAAAGLFKRRFAKGPKTHGDGKPRPRSLGQRVPGRVLAFCKTHQTLCAVALVGIVAAGVFFTERGNPDDAPGGGAANSPMVFDEIEIHGPEETAPKGDETRPASGVKIEPLEPPRTADTSLSIGEAGSEDGPRLFQPAAEPRRVRRPPGKSVWLTGTIEEVEAVPSGVRRTGHVELPASKDGELGR